MIITCPKCGTNYKIQEDIISENGRKMRCANCGEIWIVKKKESTKPVKEETSANISETVQHDNAKTDQNVEPKKEIIIEPKTEIKEIKTPVKDFEDVYSRLNAKSESIEKEYENLSFFKKKSIAFKKKTGLDSRFNRFLLYISLLGLILLSLLYFRFDIVKKYPFTAEIYEMVGIKVNVVGYGLEFKNISKADEIVEGKEIIEVKGFIHNKTNEEISVPKISIELFSADGKVEKKETYTSPEPKVGGKNQFSFEINIERPQTPIKYIVLTFSE